jgi:hypothetical protein
MIVRSELKPSSCSGITLTQVRYVSSGANFGTNTSGQLWLGNAGAGSTINAGKNGDCIVPGALASGTVTLNGGSGGGADVCYDGPGPGTFTRTSCSATPSGTSPVLTVATSAPGFA